MRILQAIVDWGFLALVAGMAIALLAAAPWLLFILCAGAFFWFLRD